jgi:cytochrome P450
MAEESLPVGVALTMMDPGYSADPHSRLDRVRAACPVQWDHVAGAHRLVGYEDVRAVVADRSLWRDPDKAEARAVFYKTTRRVPEGFSHPKDTLSNVIFLDDPDHARIRGAISEFFNERVASSAPMVRRIVAQQLSALPAAGKFDLIADFAMPIPILVMAAILGVEDERLNEFNRWSAAAIDSFNPARTPEATARMIKEQNAAVAYFDAAIKARRTSPGDDLISDLVRDQGKNGTLSDADIRYNCLVMLAAATMTTSDLIGLAIWYVLSTPGALAAINAEPTKVKAAVEETLRIAPSVESTTRVASHELEIEGRHIKKGEVIIASLIAANHDPAVFPNPHQFDIARAHNPQSPHIAFGGGSHVCMGAALARIEANIALSALFSRYPNLSLADTTPRWRTSLPFRGLDRLDVNAGGSVG